MHPITQRPNFLLFITWLSYFSRNCHAVLNSEYATHNCDTYTAIGAAQVCCNGACADGTTVDSPTGLCENWLSPFYDPRNVPACTSTQLWSYTTSTSVAMGGTCATGCQWESEQYTYKCCKCPSGYVSDTINYEQSIQIDPIHYDLCFGCTDAGENLTYDPTTGTYSCQVSTLQELCSAAPGLENSLTAFGNLDSWLGAVCPTTSLLSAIIKVFVDIYDLFQTITNPTNGVSGTEFTAASDVISTISAFLLTAGFMSEGVPVAGITAAMGTVWATICTIISAAGAAISGANKGLKALQSYGCPGTNSRRSISPDVSAFSSFELIHAYSRRDVGYNPCIDFLSYFPTDYTTAALADTSCDQINLYDASATEDATVAAAITDMQQFCSAYQGSGNSTMIMDLQNMLSAIEAAVPYCDTTQTSTSSSASGSLVTGTSSLPSSTTAPSSSTLASLSQTSSLSSVSVEPSNSSSISTRIPGSSPASTISSNVAASLSHSTCGGSASTSTGAPGISSLSPSGPLGGSSGSSVRSQPASEVTTSSNKVTPSAGSSNGASASFASPAPGYALSSLAIHATSISRIWVTCMLISITLVL